MHSGWLEKLHIGNSGRGIPVYGLRRCYEVDVLVPNNWNGASASGVNKTFSSSTNLKNK